MGKKQPYKLDVDFGEVLYNRLQDEAKKQNIKPSKIVRQSLEYFLAKDEPIIVNQKRKSADRQLVSEYERKKLRLEAAISNNINQLAKAMNTLIYMHKSSSRDIQRVRIQLQRILDIMHGHIEVFL